jgi:hypothetical protein
MKMSRMSRKSKVAALLGVLTIASSGALVPPPAQARPSCEDLVRQDCARFYEGQQVWELDGYYSLENCVEVESARTCPPRYYGATDGIREESPV